MSETRFWGVASILILLLVVTSVAQGSPRAAQTAPGVVWVQECVSGAFVVEPLANGGNRITCYGDTPTTPTATVEVPPTRPPASTTTTTTTTTPTLSPTLVPSVGPTSGNTVVVSPGQDIGRAIGSSPAGATIYLRGGIHNVGTSSHYNINLSGRHLASYPGERAVVLGLIAFSLANASVSNIHFQWAGGSSSAHMVKLNSGSNWVFRDNEVSGAESYACVLVTGSPNNWKILNNHIHDCVGGNGDPNQNHGIYVNAPGSQSGLVEGNEIHTIPMGRGLKLGPASSGDQGPQNTIIRGNRIRNTYRSSISISGGNISNLLIERNDLRDSPESAIRFYQATGGANVVIQNNTYGGVPTFCRDNDSSVRCSTTVKGGNVAD